MAQTASYPADFQSNGGVVVEGGNLIFTGTAVPVSSLGGLWIPPVADPHVVGAVWNDSGTLTISAG